MTIAVVIQAPESDNDDGSYRYKLIGSMSEKTYTVVSTMKNEGPFIVEWVAHYKALGFDHLVVCTNDCEDTTSELLRALGPHADVIQHDTNVWPRAGIQRSALKQSKRYRAVKRADWIFVCDADEFLTIKVGDGTVQALSDASGEDSDVISVPWRVFGPSGVTNYRDQPVVDQFAWAESETDTRKEARKFVKSLFTGQRRFKRIGLHAPIPSEEWKGKIKTVLPGGIPLEKGTKREAVTYDHAQVNHYALRSMDSYLVKRARGRANHSSHVLGLEYWNRFNINQVQDYAINRYAARVKELRDSYMSDPRVAELHQAAVAWHQEKITEIKADPVLQDLITSIAATYDQPC